MDISKLSQFQVAQMEAILGPELEPFENFISDYMESSSEEDVLGPESESENFISDNAESSSEEGVLGPESESENFISDNAESSSEEDDSMFNLIKHHHPESLAIKLSGFLSSHSHDVDFRENCICTLYDLLCLDEGHTWNKLSVSTQSTIKSILVDSIKFEEPKSIIKNLCYTISDLCDIFLPSDDNWPELLPFLRQCVTSNSNKLRDSFFLIFAGFSKSVCERLVPDMKISYPVFLSTLNDDTLHPRVRIAVLTTAVRFILYLPSSNERKWFQNLLPAMLRSLTYAVRDGDQDDAAQKMLNIFIELAENDPRFFRRQLVDVVHDMFEIAEAKSSAEETKHLAVEFLLTLVEAKKKAPGMMKKLRSFTNDCFTMILNMLLDIEDEPSWYSMDTKNSHAGETENYSFGRKCLDRFSIALGGQTIAPIAMEQLGAYFVAPEWEKRHAALRALFQIAEGSSKVMIKYLEHIVKAVLHSFQDPHPRVRWAASRAIDQLAIDFYPDLQEQYHNQVVPAIVAAMDDIPRVQVAAAWALSEFYDSQKAETLIPHLDRTLNKLIELLETDNQMVKEAAMQALIDVANVSKKEHFLKFYDFVMPYLKTVLVNANDKYNQELRSRALQCISYVGLAVGKEKFRDDIEQVMEMLKSLQELQDPDSIIYVLRACHAICNCMGKEFLPYMSTVMPPLVEYAQLELDTDLDESDDDSIHMVKFGDEMICIKRSDLLKAKSKACIALDLFAEELEEAFYPWITQAASILVPLLQFDIDDNVREDAIRAMSSLLRSANLAEEKGTAQGGIQLDFKQLSGEIILAMENALYLERETDICAIILSELDECLKICGPLLNEDQVRSIIDVINHVIRESSLRKGELIDTAKLEDFDAEVADLLREEREQEEEVFSNVVDILITLIETFEDAFLPFHDELPPDVMPTRGKDETTQERGKRIYIFNALVEHCGEVALKYYNLYLPFLLDASNDDNPYVREAAVYGLRLCAEYRSYAFKPFIGEALSRINVVITHSNALKPENVTAYDNAVSALGKICQFHRENIDSAQIIPAWLNCLPIKDDVYEAKAALDQLCSMVERSDADLLGPNYLHLPKIISVFTEVLCDGGDLVTEETANRMIHLLRHFKETLPLATLASARALLLPQQEMELKSILSPEEDVNVSADAMKLPVL
ncbi:uncharacterized protein LOC132032929 isoform X1 [Lycium ferocissimum]|uniref:uncharacterized protein LOC132032929 isoform X1 n=1 Tax=Lycium ferocissimum TaxID=112874 RepID=UPI0028155FE8|nr:uncharacterized protein LOC132032929 isoform X1 [Lycium ferocissimum]